MRGGSEPRAVIVTRRSEYELLLLRHGTHEQARFFLETRDQDIEVVRERHETFLKAREAVTRGIPASWRRSSVDRIDLDRFLFEPGDIVVAIGQDGLVANTAKYLDGQVVVGINPDPDMYEGVLVPHAPKGIEALLRSALEEDAPIEARSMVEAKLDDGQSLVALNEIFIGHCSHQSARYQIAWAGARERQSSSGILVSSGTGATGWAKSVYRGRDCDFDLPCATERRLVFFVREAWPSVSTETDLCDGDLDEDEELAVTSEMDGGGVIFGDGIEEDRIEFSYGRRATIGIAQKRLLLLAA